MVKYIPLQEYLKQRYKSNQEIYLSFRKMEEIIQEKLPPVAYHNRSWWANEVEGTHVQAKAWLTEGWKVDMVDFEGEVIRFIQRG